LRDGRYFFVGRGGGIINVGGLKVHPEEVEAVINSHPRVRMSLVRSRRNPITGAVVTADVVLADAAGAEPAADERIRHEILDACRTMLAPHKVPALIRFVPTLAMSASGKLVRPNESPAAPSNA
jgi:acyl-coenzyme A synthetase/AMP-(fatty) acid ligase